MSKARFITIPTSHYCEKARWALDLAGIAYEEEMHMPAFHIRHAKKAGGLPTVPVLVTAHEVFADSTDILQFAHRTAPSAGLYPQDPAMRKEVEDFEELCDEVIGTHARRIIYSFLLDQKKAFLQTFPPNCPRGEVIGLSILFPLFRMLVKRAYKINPDSVQRSCVKVREVFAQVEERLAEGGAYLFGDTLTAADIAFACTSVPVVVPNHYFVKLPELNNFPKEAQDLVNPFRESKAGLYAQKLFREDRNGLKPA